MIRHAFFRTVRQNVDSSYANGGVAQYIRLSDYAINPQSDIRSYLLLQKEYLELLEFIEPSDKNAKAYSLRNRDLLIRICTEIESNFKSILRANRYTLKPERNWDIRDYQRTDKSHYLSKYEVIAPYWDGNKAHQKPFSRWRGNRYKSPRWYHDYNRCKHDRSSNLHLATMENLTQAMAGLTVLISSQYYLETMSGNDYLIAETGDSTYDWAIGERFQIKFPDIPARERYAFEHSDISSLNLLQKFDYDSIRLTDIA